MHSLLTLLPPPAAPSLWQVPVFSLFKRLFPGEVFDVPTTAATTSTAGVTSPAAASALTPTSRTLLQDSQAKVAASVGGTGQGSSVSGTGASTGAQDGRGGSRQQSGAVGNEGMSGSGGSGGGGGNSGGGETSGSGSGTQAGSSQLDGHRTVGQGAGRNDMEGSSTGSNRRSLVSAGSTGQQIVAGRQRLAAGTGTGAALAAAGVGAGAKAAVEAGAGAASAVGGAATAGARARAVPKAAKGTAGAAAGAGTDMVVKEAAGAAEVAGVAVVTGIGAAAAGAAAGPAGVAAATALEAAAAAGVAVPVVAGGTVITLEPGYGRQDPIQDEDFQDEEILLPNFNQDWGRLCFYPWEKKNHAALMRASLQVCGGSR